MSEILNQLSPEMAEAIIQLWDTIWEAINGWVYGISGTMGASILFYIRKYLKLKASANGKDEEIAALMTIKDEVIADSKKVIEDMREKYSEQEAKYTEIIQGWQTINSMLLGEIPMSTEKVVQMAETIKESKLVAEDIQGVVLEVLENKPDFQEFAPYTETLKVTTDEITD